MTDARLVNPVKLADKTHRVMTFRADVKTPAGMKERLYRVTLPTGALKREAALFETYVSRPRRSYMSWHALPAYGTTANQLWGMILESEKEKTDV